MKGRARSETECRRRPVKAVQSGRPRTSPDFHMSTQSATHYVWQDLPTDRPMDKLMRRRIIGDRMMLSEVFLHNGCHVPTHAHENEQFCLVISGRLRFGIGDERSQGRREITVSAGEVLHLPSNVPHSADALEDTLVIDLFSPPSQGTGIDRPQG